MTTDESGTTEPLPGSERAPGISRRSFLRSAGLGAAGLALGGPLLAACSAGSGATTTGAGGGGGGGGGAGVIRIGFVSPLTGPDAAFGQVDTYIIGLARRAFAKGLRVGGKTYDVEILQKDGQSNPQVGSQVAQDLINGNGVDFMLTTSTPETVNPVSDACEAAGVPCVSTTVPWQSWYYGRGAKPGQLDAYKFTYHFCFGVEQFYLAYTHLWPQVRTNKRVGVMWPNDADGNAIRASLGPMLAEAGYTIDDPGAYPDGTNNYSSQISLFKRDNSEIFNTFPIPSDFVTFWEQAAQQGYKPRIAQIAKTGLFPSQVEAVGPLGYKLAGAAYWTPTFPYTSSLTGLDSKALADDYENSTGNQWTMQLGASLGLFDVASAALRESGAPKDKTTVADTIAKLGVETLVGKLQWGTGPVANVVATPIIGGQWLQAPPGSRYKLEFVICEHSADPAVPIAATLQPYT
jgi:branched-chain amino acid transport system substrate-binding protein